MEVFSRTTKRSPNLSNMKSGKLLSENAFPIQVLYIDGKQPAGSGNKYTNFFFLN